MAAISTKSGGAHAPDAWNDDDWGTGQKPASASEATENVEGAEKSPAPTTANPQILLAKKPASSPNLASADDISTHMQNMQLWNAANEGGSFEVVAAAAQPGKTLYRPELKILKRATNTNSPERDPNKTGSRTPKSDAGSDAEGRKETPQEKMERERKEKEERYARARERLFGPDTSGNGGGDSMEKNPSSNGKNSGTATPSGIKSTSQQNKNIPSRKTSPSRQRRRERVDDDFVPRSAMVAGTVESYQLDQQLQAEAQMREIQSRAPHFQPNVPQPQYLGYQSQYTGPPPGPGNFNYNNQPGFPPFPQQQQPPFNGGQNINFPQRQLPNAGGSPWNNTYSPLSMRPPLAAGPQYNQFQNQNHLPYPSQQQQVSPPGFQPPYSAPFQPGGLGNLPLPLPPPPQLAQNLYDPNYSQKPGNLQFFNQNNANGPQAQFPVREPKAPDGTGRGGFGFTTRGGSHVGGSGVIPHPAPLPQGRDFPNPMFSGNNPQNLHGGQGAGFNSPAAAAPWGVTSPIGNQQPGQIWGNVPNGNVMNGPQGYSGQQPLMGSSSSSSSYSGLGQNNVWGNPGTWNTAGGQGPGRGKR